MGWIPDKKTLDSGFQGFKTVWQNPENLEIQVFVFRIRRGLSSAIGGNQNGLADGEVEGLG